MKKEGRACAPAVQQQQCQARAGDAEPQPARLFTNGKSRLDRATKARAPVAPHNAGAHMRREAEVLQPAAPAGAARLVAAPAWAACLGCRFSGSGS